MRLSRARLQGLYRSLHRAYGPQRWWPASAKFEMMAGAVLVQNTNWNNAARAIAALKQARMLNPARIAALPLPKLAALIRSSGTHRVKARRLKALCHWLLEQGGIAKAGKWATGELRHSLLAVHGIGPETADCILLYAYGRPLFVADAYARRLLTRLGFELPSAHYEPVRHAVESCAAGDVRFYNEFHALIVRHCKVACRAEPLCGECVLRRNCAYARKLGLTGRRTAAR